MPDLTRVKRNRAGGFLKKEQRRRCGMCGRVVYRKGAAVCDGWKWHLTCWRRVVECLTN